MEIPGERALVADGYWCATLGRDEVSNLMAYQVSGQPANPFEGLVSSLHMNRWEKVHLFSFGRTEGVRIGVQSI